METVSECNIIVEVQNNTYDFTSPGWPYGYDSFLSCNWVFFSPSGTHLKLRFLTMDLEETSECTDDFVAVYSGNALTDESNAKLLQKLCLANSTSVDIDVDNVMTVKFETDGYRNNSGFSAFVSKGVKLFFSFFFFIRDMRSFVDLIAQSVVARWKVQTEWSRWMTLFGRKDGCRDDCTTKWTVNGSSKWDLDGR